MFVTMLFSAMRQRLCDRSITEGCSISPALRWVPFALVTAGLCSDTCC
eukprot:SM000016S01814  [mRNA]  locus=s16:71798:71941:+ [translate_table: standard]